MISRTTIVILVIVFCVCTTAFAGTWSDGFQGEKIDNWQLSQVGPTTFKTENGKLCLEVHSEFISSLGVIGSNQWKDYTLTVKVKILEIFGPFVDGGIYVHYTEPNFYYFFIADRWSQVYPGIPPEGKGAFVFPWINGQVQKGQAKVFTPELDHWYTLKATVKGSSAEFYVDNNLVGAFDYVELTSGSVGLVVSNALVHFDDFVVTGPNIPDGGPGISVNQRAKLATKWGEIKSDS